MQAIIKNIIVRLVITAAGCMCGPALLFLNVYTAVAVVRNLVNSPIETRSSYWLSDIRPGHQGDVYVGIALPTVSHCSPDPPKLNQNCRPYRSLHLAVVFVWV